MDNLSSTFILGYTYLSFKSPVFLRSLFTFFSEWTGITYINNNSIRKRQPRIRNIPSNPMISKTDTIDIIRARRDMQIVEMPTE
ncbi:MAG TPA: hypothetical protein O0X21_01660 [Methanocorpusculum sp.]|nr:hypothetical protein [Methanocorpusculum sp.]HJJ68911.1 hypothetical protein [Methanocorpusculum sp.]HJJ80794.1 hypothetical protein [Methanocorpusculum sp.]